MKSQNKLKLAGALLGATLMTATTAVAGGSDGKCGASKCGNKTKSEKEMMLKKKDGKCGAGSCGDKAATKKMDDKSKKMKQANKDADAKCGTGKCG
ncbi:hypothetical protein ACKGJI_09475 [Sulfurospirillum sp. 1307]|jgi:uncharacterized low-complexity protein